MGRGKKAFINTIASLSEQLIAVICGFILPRMILTTYGSQYNGLVSSITQFLGYTVLLKAGISGATRAALYKPLANNDKEKISGIIRASDIYLKKIGGIMLAIIVVLAVIYPFIVANEFEWFFVFSLFLIIGASTFAETFFGSTYIALLNADQRLWVSAILQSICYIINTIVAVFIMRMGYSIHLVKLGSAVIYVLSPIILSIYAKRHYQIDKQVKPDNIALSQRWDSFWHQIAAFVMGNTDIVVLTAFSGLMEVSVYSVYNLVSSGLKRVVESFTNGIEAAFGNMIAKGEYDTLRSALSAVELLIYSLCTVIYTTTCLTILSFVRVYTSGIVDVDYIRPAFAYVFVLGLFFNGIRWPYQSVVLAAGHYKQTKRAAIAEPIIHILISVALVIKFGLVGVAVGTLVAIVFRTVYYSLYISKNIVCRSSFISFCRMLVSFLEMTIIVLIVNMLPINSPSSYFTWVLYATSIFIISCVVVILGCIVFYRNDFKVCCIKVKGIISR